MSRTSRIEFKMCYTVCFSCAIRGHHIYKTSWTPIKDEHLYCRKDERAEAADYDKHAIGVYKKDGTLVGHIPIEISNLIDYFYKSSPDNRVDAKVTGKRKREIGLVVPAKYFAITQDLKVAKILQDELEKKKKRYSHFEMEFDVNQALCKKPVFQK